MKTYNFLSAALGGAFMLISQISLCQNTWNGSGIQTATTNGTIITNTGNVIVSTGKIGIGVSSPTAALHFGNVLRNKTIAMWDDNTANNDSYYGLGINSSMMRYQVGFSGASHVFYAGSNSTTGASTSSTELMRIQGNGMVGIGTSSPTQMLHIKSQTAKVLLDATIGLGGNAGIDFAGNGALQYGINFDVFPYCGSPQFKIGSLTGGSTKMIIFRNNDDAVNSPSHKIVFSSSSAYGFGSCSGSVASGISGDYLFDGQVGATSLLVAPSSTTVPYPAIPSGYLFNVQGKSNFTDNVVIGSISNFTASTPFPTGYKLFVQDGIITEKLKIALKSSSDWSDYVFSKEYQLRPLSDVEKYVSENKHLPGVPSAQEVVDNGLDVAKMDAKLLEKIEELTLYMIQQQKQLQVQKAEIDALKAKLSDIK